MVPTKKTKIISSPVFFYENGGYPGKKISHKNGYDTEFIGKIVQRKHKNSILIEFSIKLSIKAKLNTIFTFVFCKKCFLQRKNKK
jgi:hypothetical protein